MLQSLTRQPAVLTETAALVDKKKSRAACDRNTTRYVTRRCWVTLNYAVCLSARQQPLKLKNNNEEGY